MMNKLRVLLIAIIILAVILTGITAFSVYENHELTINYQELYSQYEALQNKYEILKSNYTEILANYTNMKSQYGPLLSQYQSLQSNYYVLQQDYYVLQQNYENVSNLINAIMYGESGQGNATIDSGYQQYFGLVFVPMVARFMVIYMYHQMTDLLWYTSWIGLISQIILRVNHGHIFMSGRVHQ